MSSFVILHDPHSHAITILELTAATGSGTDAGFESITTPVMNNTPPKKRGKLTAHSKGE
jgi:hypothetical protein